MLLCFISSNSTVHSTNNQNLSLSNPLYASHIGPREFSSLPWLQLVQMGSNILTIKGWPLPQEFTCQWLQQDCLDYWSVKSSDPDMTTLWVAACVCFFGFFCSGEITVPSTQTSDPAVHLSWGDIAVDNPPSPTAIFWVYLKRSKCDQFGKGVEAFVSRTTTPICPIAAVPAYIAVQTCMLL